MSTLLKIVSANFHFFTEWQILNNYEKCFLFHLKSSFSSQDILISVFPPSPFHCFREWSKINLRVYDVIICLNKNLITHFVWYLGEAKSQYEEGGAHIRISFCHLLMNLKNSYRKKLMKWANKKQNNFNISNVAFF